VLLARVDVLDAVALVGEGRTVGARESLPTVVLACVRVAGQVDTQQARIVDRQDRVMPALPCPSCGKDVAASEFFKFKDDGEATTQTKETAAPTAPPRELTMYQR
jgi:hypothetical protein